jgi:hypothetical protein
VVLVEAGNIQLLVMLLLREISEQRYDQISSPNQQESMGWCRSSTALLPISKASRELELLFQVESTDFIAL